MEKLDLSVIILTGNEEIHIRRCLDRICDIAKEVFIIDCFSTDATVQIAKEYPEVCVLQHAWVNYATQFNWGLDNAPIRTKWVLRLDADEYLEDDLKARMRRELPAMDEEVSAIDIRLKHVFLGKVIKGGTGKKYMTRIFRYGKAKSEVRQMDEHIQVTEGKKMLWEEAFCDDNLNNLTWWTTKHNGYSIREAVDLLDVEFDLSGIKTDGTIGEQALTMRKNKLRYAKMPLFLRSAAYFFYRYFFKGGFLEGSEGFIWCFLQGWWYRTLVDAKIYEIKKACGNDKERIRLYLKTHHNIVFQPDSTFLGGGNRRL